MSDRKLLLERLERLAFILDELMPHCGELVRDSIVLLKEQEPKQIKTDMYGNYYCPWCSTDTSIEMGIMKLKIGTSYCPYCGRPVKWDDNI